MPLAPRLNQYINEQGIVCQLLHHARSNSYESALSGLNISPEAAAKLIALIDIRGPAAVVIPSNESLDLALLNKALGRSFQVLSESNTRKLFSDCEPGSFPVFAAAYKLPLIVDPCLLESDHVYSPTGCGSALVKVPKDSFQLAMRGAIKARVGKVESVESSQNLAFSSMTNETSTSRLNLEHSLQSVAHPKEKISGLVNAEQGISEQHSSQQHSSEQISANNARGPSIGLAQAAKKLDKLYKLPPMPETAVKILHLIADDEAGVHDLALLIEKDPSLSAQVMRYARSALFNYRGELTCIKEAVNIVLGFDRVAQLSMGLAASKAFNVPSSGPFGLQAFWKHSLHSAVLCQALALMANPELALDEREAYLAGMLHNFGILLIGHLFPPEFRMLNKLRSAEPDASMRQLEEQVFGMGGAQEFITMGHGTIGAILLKMWGLPESTVKAAGMHQNLDYVGEHQHYVALVQLSNALLSEYELGDEPITADTSILMRELGLDPAKVDALVETLMEQCSSLDGMIQSMAA